MKKHEIEFDKIAENMFEQTDAVVCTMQEFFDGLRNIRAAIDNRLLEEQVRNKMD